MKYTNTLVLVFMILLGAGILIAFFFIPSGTFMVNPKTKLDGSKWRIAYYEGGNYSQYPELLFGIATGLEKLGWIESVSKPKKLKSSKEVYSHLVRNTKSKYIEFVQDGFWTGAWNPDMRTKNLYDFMSRVKKERDIDLVIAMGTAAGEDLATSDHSVPVIVVGAADPVRSKIVKSAYDSGLDHVHAKCTPDKYLRQIRAFHNIVGFSKLGIVFENTSTGKLYANVPDIVKASKQIGFEVVPCHAPWQMVSRKESKKRLMDCYKELSSKVDAMWLQGHLDEKPENMPEILSPLFKQKIPTWSQVGHAHVEKGVLFSITERSPEDVGLFHARVIASVFNGKKPRSIPQIYEDPKSILINKKTAELIHFQIPIGLLHAADKIYTSIEKNE